ncbi:hypothetical protein GCM10027419_28540 [Pandoraea terrae]
MSPSTRRDTISTAAARCAACASNDDSNNGAYIICPGMFMGLSPEFVMSHDLPRGVGGTLANVAQGGKVIGFATHSSEPLHTRHWQDWPID